MHMICTCICVYGRERYTDIDACVCVWVGGERERKREKKTEREKNGQCWSSTLVFFQTEDNQSSLFFRSPFVVGHSPFQMDPARGELRAKGI